LSAEAETDEAAIILDDDDDGKFHSQLPKKPTNRSRESFSSTLPLTDPLAHVQCQKLEQTMTSSWKVFSVLTHDFNSVQVICWVGHTKLT